MTSGGPSPGTGFGSPPPPSHTPAGFHVFRLALAQRLPYSLRTAQRLNRASLARLARGK